MDCTLHGYPSRGAAEYVATTLGKPFVAYPCTKCGEAWHVFREQPRRYVPPDAFAKARQKTQGAQKFSCEGKRRYITENAAKGDQGALKGRIHAYHCTYCKYWHNGAMRGK